jgi:acyl carrier protein
MITADRRAEVTSAVKRMVIIESRLAVPEHRVRDDEPLNGELLRVNSLGFLGMLVKIEDELDVVLPDDLFVSRPVETVADVVDLVLFAVEENR